MSVPRYFETIMQTRYHLDLKRENMDKKRGPEPSLNLFHKSESESSAKPNTNLNFRIIHEHINVQLRS